MFFPTDILRAALHCVAGENETREYLKGVHITPTHIKATDGRALVMMEHRAKTNINAVFVVHGKISPNAEGTFIENTDGAWVAIHVDENMKTVGTSNLEKMDCCYPDFTKLLPPKPEPWEEVPIFSARLLALPQLMFGTGLPVKLKPYGSSAPCLVMIDPATSRFYGNPFLVIMPMHDNAFEICRKVFDEK